jgi:dolichol-phosphate mannosyltransferase
MTLNFDDDVVTHRDRRPRGRSLLRAHLWFYLVGTVGALAHSQIAQMHSRWCVAWPLAGLLGAMVGAVWNDAVSSALIWPWRI